MNQQLGKSKNIDNLLRVSVAECLDTEWRVKRKEKLVAVVKTTLGFRFYDLSWMKALFSRSFSELNNRKDVKIASP